MPPPFQKSDKPASSLIPAKNDTHHDSNNLRYENCRDCLNIDTCLCTHFPQISSYVMGVLRLKNLGLFLAQDTSIFFTQYARQSQVGISWQDPRIRN